MNREVGLIDLCSLVTCNVILLFPFPTLTVLNLVLLLRQLEMFWSVPWNLSGWFFIFVFCQASSAFWPGGSGDNAFNLFALWFFTFRKCYLSILLGEDFLYISCVFLFYGVTFGISFLWTITGKEIELQRREELRDSFWNSMCLLFVLVSCPVRHCLENLEEREPWKATFTQRIPALSPRNSSKFTDSLDWKNLRNI